jgi:putative SOS response-associated peptidase YedK
VFAAAFINKDNLAVATGKSERDAGSGNEDALRTYEVSTLVDDPRNDSRTCIEPTHSNISPASFS